jgi:uncharacterized membrane protein
MTDTPLHVRMYRLADHADLVATLCKPVAEYAAMIRLQEHAEWLRETARRLEASE